MTAPLDSARFGWGRRGAGPRVGGTQTHRPCTAVGGTRGWWPCACAGACRAEGSCSPRRCAAEGRGQRSAWGAPTAAAGRGGGSPERSGRWGGGQPCGSGRPAPEPWRRRRGAVGLPGGVGRGLRTRRPAGGLTPPPGQAAPGVLAFPRSRCRTLTRPCGRTARGAGGSSRPPGAGAGRERAAVRVRGRARVCALRRLGRLGRPFPRVLARPS